MAKRANGEGLIRDRPDGRWEAQIRLPGGVRKSIYGKTQKEVREKLLTVQNDMSDGRPVVSEKITVGEFLDRWLEDVVRVKNDAKTARDYEMIVRVHIKPVFGKTPLKSLSGADIQRWLNRLGCEPMKKGRTDEPLSARSIHYYRATFRAAMNQAV